ncbi:MAG: hypothetical protein IPN76_26785 [Saprospiraceae bacterium]|nr:hypothetical protein [Saprospiraceae bacterium]
MKIKSIFYLVLFALTFCSCKKAETEAPNNLVFSIHFDPEQPRLDNLGEPSQIPSGHAAQTPTFRGMSIHYIELAQNAFVPLGGGAILYQGKETMKGGENAVDFDQAKTVGDGEQFVTISLSDLPPGSYEWVRTSVTYQHYDIKYNLQNVPVIGEITNQSGTVASFVGFNTYISELKPNEHSITVNDDKKQGFWAFEPSFSAPYQAYNSIYSGQAPTAATTVVNPIFDTSPVPPGSCVVTGKFATPLIVTGDETRDVKVRLAFSINNSFEWKEEIANGQLDFFADDASKNERIVDMGLRGLVPSWE